MRGVGSRLPASAVLALGCVAVACFADLSGFSGGSDPVSSGDASPPTDGSALLDALDAPSGEGAPGSCEASTSLVTSFAADLGGFLPLSYRVAGYPRAASFLGDPAAVLFPVPDSGPIAVDAGPDVDGGTRIGPLEVLDARSGIWSPSPVPLVAFDVDVEVQIRCTGLGSCADGLMIAWLDLATPAKLTNLNIGHKAGIPEGVAGAAVDIDDYMNDPSPEETSDPPAPTIQVIAFDPTKPVGTYPWVVSYKSQSFVGAWHKISIKLRDGLVSVRFDDADLVSGKVPPIASGLFGLTAGTGGETNAIAVRNLRGTFYACTP